MSLRINDRKIDRWQTYSIENDMLNDADTFTLALAPGTREVYDLVPPDARVEVRIDDVQVLTGLIDERSYNVDKGGATLTVTGRDLMGRMVDESADLRSFGRLDIKTLAEQLAAPNFGEVKLSNAENRDLVRGRRSGKAAAGTEPIISKRSEAPKKVEPGESRLDVLKQFLEPARLLAWASADGRSLIVGLPNYNQGVQFRFFVPRQGSARRTFGNVLSADFTDSVTNRYSKIRVTGASRGDSNRYGTQVTRHTATVLDGPTPDGTSVVQPDGTRRGSFFVRKQLILSDDDVKNEGDATERAGREFALRDAEARVLELTVLGHSQKRAPNEQPAIYAFDTLAEVEIEEIGLKEPFLITSVNFTVDKSGGEITRMRLVPRFTELVS